MLAQGGSAPHRDTILTMRRATLLLLLMTCAAWTQKAPFDVQTMMKVVRISDPQLSPDGRTVAFTAQRIDVEGNSRPSQIYIVPLAGGAPRQITREGSLNQRPRWSPDSRRLAFISD